MLDWTDADRWQFIGCELLLTPSCFRHHHYSSDRIHLPTVFYWKVTSTMSALFAYINNELTVTFGCSVCSFGEIALIFSAGSFLRHVLKFIINGKQTRLRCSQCRWVATKAWPYNAEVSPTVESMKDLIWKKLQQRWQASMQIIPYYSSQRSADSVRMKNWKCLLAVLFAYKWNERIHMGVLIEMFAIRTFLDETSQFFFQFIERSILQASSTKKFNSSGSVETEKASTTFEENNSKCSLSWIDARRSIFFYHASIEWNIDRQWAERTFRILLESKNKSSRTRILDESLNE